MTEVTINVETPEQATLIVMLLQVLGNAKNKHPTWPDCPVKQAAIVAEEAGELIREANHIDEGKGDYLLLKAEALQTAATAFRLLEVNYGK